MTDVPKGPAAATPKNPEVANFMTGPFKASLLFANRSPGGGESSRNLFNEPEKVKKTPKILKKEPNKRLEAWKKIRANQKAKYLETEKKLKRLQLLAEKERVEKQAQKRRSLLQKDEERIQMLNEKINNLTAQ